MKTQTFKTYSELIKLKTFEERFEYLQTNSLIGQETFGKERYLNQMLYTSQDWKSARQKVIIRDNACDLAMPDREIRTKVFIHHINPITIDDVLNRNKIIFDLENLICVSADTHNAIHYGSMTKLMPSRPNERKPYDTCPWRQ